MTLLEWLIHGTIPVPGGELGAREVIGNLFGLASAILGMKRFVWAWPIGLVGNVLLFTVFATGELSGQIDEPLWGQAGRQVFFAVVSRLRLVALVAAEPGRWRLRRRRDRTPLGDLRRAAAAARARRRRLRGGVRPADAGARLVGPDDRGLDPRRLDAGDVRHGARLGGVLAGLGPGRHRRRDHAGAGGLLPDRRDVPLLRRVRGDRLLRVAACRPHGRRHHATPTSNEAVPA